MTFPRLIGHEGRRFVCYWYFVGWWALSFGVHVDVDSLNAEIHLPFGFLRIGCKSKVTIVDGDLVLRMREDEADKYDWDAAQ